MKEFEDELWRIIDDIGHEGANGERRDLVVFKYRPRIIELVEKYYIPKPEEDKSQLLLNTLISIINPKEKATADRLRKLNARRKEYTDEEITNAAKAFSQSEWHRENKQMSIDNLLAPSKFGRWYAASTETNKRKFD